MAVMNAKVRVVKNIGRNSEEIFGGVGTVHDVVDGILTDFEGFEWTQDRYIPFTSIDDINHLLDGVQRPTAITLYDTVFELVQD